MRSVPTRRRPRRAVVALVLALGVVSALLAIGTASQAAVTASAPSVSTAAAPSHLTIAQLPAPVDLETLDHPLLAWQVGGGMQAAYQVQVARTAAALDDASVWDSGKVTSPESTNVAYDGPSLVPSEGYYWRVRTWDAQDQASDWSSVSHFGTGPGSQWSGAHPIWAPAATGWTDFTYTGTFTIGTVAASVNFRESNTTNFYMWQFRASNTTDPNTLKMHANVNGSYAVIGLQALPFALAAGTSYDYRIVTQGSQITTWLKPSSTPTWQQVNSITNSALTSGWIGFRTGSTENATYDNLVVTDPNGTQLYANDFSTATTDFSCGTVTAGRLSVGTSKNCGYSKAESTSWAFLRGDVDLAAGKQVAWAHLYATGASPEPARQFVYKMWVDGRFVGVGPTRSIGNEVRYDGYDVTDDLTAGTTHTIGALAYTTSDQRFLAQLVVRYTDGTTQTFGTGSGWRTITGNDVLPDAGSVGTSYYTAPKENFNAATYPFGFSEPGFDASAWKAPAVKADFTTLAATPTAKVQVRLEHPTSVVEKSPGNYFIDYGRTWVGGLSLDLNGTAGQAVDIRYGEVTSAPQTVRYATSAGNSYRDVWSLKQGPQHLETWGWRVFRYVEVLGAPTGLTAKDFTAEAYVYPYDDQAGQFASSDTDLDKVWQLSKNTIEAVNGDLYVDSWERERGAYEADSYLQMMSNFYTSSDPTLGNYSIAYLFKQRTWPTEWPMYIILAMHDSYAQTGDINALRQKYADLQAKLPDQWFEPSTGLIRKTSGSNGAGSCNDCDIVDWPSTERDGFVFTQYNTVINAISYRSFEDMADIATALGKDADAATYDARAAAIKTAVNARMWDASKGAYRDGLAADGTPTAHWAVQASVFATAFGLADTQQAASVASYIGSRGMVCSVYCAAFLFTALYNGDRGDLAHQLLTSTGTRSYLNMINAGAGATMEAWDLSLKSNTTYSHPWAASPAFVVPQGMFGIRPTTPGYATFDVKPQPDPLDWAHVTVPTLRGEIGASFDRVGDRVDVGAYVPPNSTARIFVPDVPDSTDVVYVDGFRAAVTHQDGFGVLEDVAPGCHVVSLVPGTSAGQDARLTSVCPDGYSAPVDDTAPSVTVTLDPATPSGSHGWYTGPVALSAVGTDDETGVAGLEIRTDGGDWAAYTGAVDVPEGVTTYDVRATDYAGNTSDPVSTTVRRDVTSPGLTWNGGPADGSHHAFGAVPAAPTCTATDAGSGPDSCLVTGYDPRVGTHTMTATATDVAGNSTVQTRGYTVDAWRLAGFFAPVDMGGVVNVVKGGSTVPLKFQVFAGSTELTDPAVVAGISTTPVSCTDGAPSDPIEAVSSGGTALRYDTASGEFVYNWKTPKSAGTCLRVSVTTQDGSVLAALFRLK